MINYLLGHLSSSCSLSCAVPQGTVLGPLLFLLYINDLPNCLSNSEPRMYADDTHPTYATNNSHNIHTSLNEDWENVQDWLRANKLTLNMTKTEFMLIGPRQRLSIVTVSPTLATNNFRVTQVATAKSLAVNIDHNLDCGSHITKIIKKVSSGIGAIKRVRHLVPQATLHLIYQALIHPHFNYLQYRLGKLWDNLKEQTSKTTKPMF